MGALYRQEMLHALESRGRAWRIAYTSGSLASLCAAVSAGLGISLLPAGSVQPGHRVLREEDGFPAVGGLELVLYARADLDAAGQTLRDRLAELCSQRAETVARV
jgi:DNA-binding transcriptional LysR family regulator